MLKNDEHSNDISESRNLNNSDDKFDKLENELKEYSGYFFAKRKDKSKINHQLWYDFYYNNGLNVNNLIGRELDRNQKKYSNEYVYIFRQNNNYFKIKFVNDRIKVLSAHKDDNINKMS
jgi:hypothetical protein